MQKTTVTEDTVIVNQIDALQAQINDLRKQARMARGTRENPVITLDQRVTDVLKRQALNTLELADRLGTTAGKLKPVMDKLREEHRLHNVGSDTEPRWRCSVGDDCPVQELHDFVYSLITDRPFTFRELVAISGARDNRISGVLTRIKSDPRARVINMGNGMRGRWFVMPKNVK